MAVLLPMGRIRHLAWALLLSVSIFQAGSGRAQSQQNIDSLLRILPQQADTNKAAILLHIGEIYRTDLKDIPHARDYLLQSKQLSIRSNIPLGVVRANNQLIYVYTGIAERKGLLDSSISLCLKHDLRTELGITYNRYAAFCFSLYAYDRAIGYYDLALNAFERSGDSERIVEEWRIIADDFYLRLNRYDKAIAELKRCISYDERRSDDILSRVMIYDELGSAYQGMARYDSALYFYDKITDLINARGKQVGSKTNIDFDWVGLNYINMLSLGDVYRLKKDHVKALGYYGPVWSYFATDRQDIPFSLYSGSAQLLLDIAQDTSVAIPVDTFVPRSRNEQIKKAISLLKTLESNDPSKEVTFFTVDWIRSLYQAYALSGDYKNAYRYLLKYVSVKDSVLSAEKATQLASAENNAVLNKMDEELLVQRSEVSRAHTRQLYFGIAIAVLSILCGFILRERRRSERERKKSDALLLNILPAEVAQELKNTGNTVARHFDDVTVIFTDFVDFTTAGERFTPQQLVNELDTCFKFFDEVVTRFGLEKIKTIGDAYLAVGGLPHPDERHAENAVEASIEIRNFMNARYAQMGDRTFQIRIGVHSGSVVAGIVGVKKFAYDIWGDTVNTAARMEQNSTPGKINISQATRDLVGDRFVCDYRGEIDTKGKGMLKMYYVSSLTS